MSSGFQEFESHARARGARAFLRKPVVPDDLLAAVERVLGGHGVPPCERDQAAQVTARREQAHRAREQLWARIDLDDPELRAMLEGVLAWLSGYTGFGTGLVDLLCNNRIFVEAGAAAKLSLDRELAFCSDVIDAGSSLVISDVADHPVFAGHKAAAYWGTRFYAGCPITLSSGLVLGTVCLIDSVPRRIGVGDMRILEYLARRVAEHFEALAHGKRPAPFFEPPALFERMAIEVILDAQLVASTDVDVVLARFARARAEPALLQRGAEAAQASAPVTRFAAARWTAESLAFVCGGARPPDATERVLAGWAEAGLVPDAVGVAQYRSTKGRRMSVSEVIGTAERACARSAAAHGAPIRTVIPARDGVSHHSP